MPPDEWLDGTVASLTSYGAFVRLEEGVDGMVHISQMDPQGQRIDSIYDYMQVSLFCLRKSKEWILAKKKFGGGALNLLGIGIGP